MRKLKVFIAMSLDGYLAAPNDDLSFLQQLPQTNEDYGYHDFIKDVDTVVMGRKTYGKLLSMEVTVPHSGCQHFVFTKDTNLTSSETMVQYSHENPVEWMRSAKSQGGRSIYCDGGASLLRAFWEADLVDEWTISIIPVLLGNGIRLFESAHAGFHPLWLNPTSVKHFESGLIQLHYARKAI